MFRAPRSNLNVFTGHKMQRLFQVAAWLLALAIVVLSLGPSSTRLVLAAPQLPPLVRVKILEYVEEKAAGRYGHGTTQRRKFIAQLSINLIEQAHRKSNQSHPTLHHQL